MRENPDEHKKPAPWAGPPQSGPQISHSGRLHGPRRGKRYLPIAFVLLALLIVIAFVVPEIDRSYGYLLRGLILLGFIGGGLFFMPGGSLRNAVKVLAIWAAIFAGLMMGYKLLDNEIRPIGAPVEVAAPADHGPLTIKRGRDGHFHYNAQVNGEPVRFLIDTGATAVLLSQRDARRLGIDLSKLEFNGTARTANGSVAFARANVAELQMGPYHFRNVPVIINGADNEKSLMGMTLLQAFSINISGNDMVLQR